MDVRQRNAQLAETCWTRLLRRTAACGFLPGLAGHALVGSRPKAKLPTEVGDTVTGPQDQGVSCTRIAQLRVVSRTQACLPRLIPNCSLRGLLSKRRGGHANSTVRNQQ